MFAFESQENISLVVSQNLGESHAHRKLSSFTTPSIFETDCVKLAAIIKLIKVLKTNLIQNKTTTIRDIYYKDVEIFNKDQEECRKSLTGLVEDGLGWSLIQDFNIHPAQKGLMYGNIFKQMDEPTLIPIDYCNYFKCNVTIPLGSSLVLIVVEKDAILHSFSKFMENKLGTLDYKFVVITGKGFSDNLTRRFATWLTQTYRTTSLGFFDSDAHGILIYKQFKSNVSQIQYSGMYLLDSSPGSHLTITARDISIMTNLASHWVSNLGPRVSRELTRGLYLYKKAEMNVVSAEDYNQYILDKVCKAQRGT
ncbi:SPO11 [Candida theae]|uniref:DNA topoisomerase (ATP-hydrolyzing) n=1 Tax=Candida theae TaxID=1198502 RepID=A0AAD5FX88_9ASCO|nr:SPO11 [Candida theae]KAI5950473.1 SPO11 [Candida theae]